MPGRKTHDEQLRTFERQPGTAGGPSADRPAPRAPASRGPNRSEFPVSRGGLHQEDRGHNKHNRAGQSGHKPQR